MDVFGIHGVRHCVMDAVQKAVALGHAAHKTHPQETSRHTDLQKINNTLPKG